MIKLTVGELFNLKRPVEMLVLCKVPLKTSYAIGKMAKLIGDELVIAGAKHDELVIEYGAKVPPTFREYAVLETSERYDEFNEKMAELKEIDIEIDAVPIVLPDTLEIEPAVLMALEKFVKVIV